MLMVEAYGGHWLRRVKAVGTPGEIDLVFVACGGAVQGRPDEGQLAQSEATGASAGQG
ncbi:hypothetical protein Ga0074812_12216 [Parafrankia irregularis]|uniref:Uncharacterized protein n=1 Tax=Parafrankia irregularis TaxID=795642 RepID=A0A0S4QT44_9ACTN|nr:hypothetical protein Ga0074812_12216 [Parafrankia irregularis]